MLAATAIKYTRGSYALLFSVFSLLQGSTFRFIFRLNVYNFSNKKHCTWNTLYLRSRTAGNVCSSRLGGFGEGLTIPHRTKEKEPCCEILHRAPELDVNCIWDLEHGILGFTICPVHWLQYKAN